MKTIKFLILSALFISAFSCKVETEDIISQDAVQGGVSLELGPNTSGKVLGNPLDPSDLENTSLNFTEVELTLQIIKRWAGEDIVKFEIYKSINGGAEVMAKESTTLPLTLTYTNINEFVAGTQITSAAGLRVGDVINFRTKVTNSAGESFFIHDGGDYTGSYSLTVSCGSDLAGPYSLTCKNMVSNFVRNHGNVTITEIGVGMYHTMSTGTYIIGSLRPDQGYNFQDVCGSITVPTQDLFDWYSNDVYQTDAQKAASVVDGATGNIVVEYSIYFAAGDGRYKDTFIKL